MGSVEKIVEVEKKSMTNIYNVPPYLIARAIRLMLANRVHFPKNRVGDIVQEDDDFLIFRQVIVDPLQNQPIHPLANFKVCFHFANFSMSTNKLLSLIPIPFIIAQPGFRSKTWMIGQKTGLFQGFYEWDTVEDAENYWTSFPLRLMKRRAVPDSMTYRITASMNFE